MSDMTCSLCTGNDTTGHEATCQATWHRPTWVNRELFFSWKRETWAWREIKNVVAAKSTYRALEVPIEEIDLGISPEEVEEALAY